MTGRQETEIQISISCNRIGDHYPWCSTYIPRAIVSVGWFVGGDEEDGRGNQVQKSRVSYVAPAFFFTLRLHVTEKWAGWGL